MATEQETEKKSVEVTKNGVRISRFFHADRSLVWRFWTEPDLMKLWWGPKGYTAPTVKIDLRVGGKNLTDMRSPEGKDFWGTGTYKEIKAPEKLVVTDSFADEKGNVVDATYYGMENFPRELLITLTFEKENAGTRMTLVHTGYGELKQEDAEGMSQGWSESFDKLEEELKKFMASH